MILLVESELVFRTKIENHWSKSNEMVPQAVQIVILLDLSNQVAYSSSGDGLLLDLIQ